MSEIIEEPKQEEPLEYRCGQCDAYYFNDPGPRCPCCGGDSMYEVWPDEQDFNEWMEHQDPNLEEKGGQNG